eukprot:1158282-Pelagomonas_calceolata.AAC.5
MLAALCELLRAIFFVRRVPYEHAGSLDACAFVDCAPVRCAFVDCALVGCAFEVGASLDCALEGCA